MTLSLVCFWQFKLHPQNISYKFYYSGIFIKIMPSKRNKRRMGHIAHLRYKRKKINKHICKSYDFIRWGENLLSPFWWMILLVKHWVSLYLGCFVPNLFEIGPVVLEKKTFKRGQCIFIILLLHVSSLGKGRGPPLK